MKLLFVCSKNQWRSPTAAKIFSHHDGLQTRSAGTSNSARHRLNEADLLWADWVMVMENKHKRHIQQQFRHLNLNNIVVLDIADDYQYMDAELIDLLKTSVEPFLNGL